MPAATNKADLLAVTEKEWAKLQALFQGLDAREAAEVDDADTSVKDVLAHRAHWIGLFFQWLEEGAAAQMPDHGVKWSELKPYNARLRAQYRTMPWVDVTAWLTDAHSRLLHHIYEAKEADLYGGPMPGGTGWTTGRYAEASGASHYRSAAKYLRAAARARAAAIRGDLQAGGSEPSPSSRSRNASNASRFTGSN